MNTIREHIGAHQINLSGCTDSSKLEGNIPIFVFDYLSMSETLRYQLSVHTCELCGYNPGSLDISWVDGQEELLKEGLSSFWFWDDNGLIPFAYIGKGAEKGPFSEHDGVLFLNTMNTKEFDKMSVILLNVEKDNVKLTTVADNFKALEIIKNKTNRQLSEQLKQEGNSFFGEGNFDAALQNFYKAIQADYTNPNPYNNIGMVSQATGNYLSRAEAFFQMSYLVDPEYTNGMRGYSSILASKGNLEKAIEIMKDCIQIEKSALNFAILSRYYLDNDDRENAEKFYLKGAEIDQNHPGLQNIKASL